MTTPATSPSQPPPPPPPPRPAAGPVTLGLAPAPPRPWWAYAIAVVVVLAVVSATLVAAGAEISTLAQRRESGRFSAIGVSSVRIDAPSVDVKITGDAEATEVTGQWSTRSVTSRAGVTWTQADGLLAIDVVCPDARWIGPPCAANLTLTVPADVALDANLTGSTLTVTALSGDIDAVLNAGLIDMQGLTSQSVRATNNAGAVNLEFDAPPHDVNASTNIGAVLVRVPDDGTVYAVTTSHNLGESKQEVPSDPQAERSIIASTNVGTAEVVSTGSSYWGDPSADPSSGHTPFGGQ